MRRMVRLGWIATCVGLLCTGAALAQYDYGGSSRGGRTSDEKYLLFLEGSLANPRNTDNVVATQISGGLSPVIPDWDDDFAGRIGLGYRLADGSKIVLSIWGFETDRGAASNAGPFAFSIGPTFSDGGEILGDTGGFFDITTEITARTADLAWSREYEAIDNLGLEWSAGLRYASYEETASGVYQDGGTFLDAAKSNEGDMIGAKVGLRATYRMQRFSLTTGLGFSFLDGELEASSSLKRTTSSSPESLARLTDDGRSGSIRDIDAGVSWHGSNDKVRITLGWEQSTWDEIAADLVRNQPGSLVALRERDSVTFSGVKLGLRLGF